MTTNHFLYLFCYFQPHLVPEKWRLSSTPRSRSLDDHGSRDHSASSQSRKTSSSRMPQTSRNSHSQSQHHLQSLARVAKKKDRARQRDKLEGTLLKLLKKQSDGVSVIDASYLLESDKRTRKKLPVHYSDLT